MILKKQQIESSISKNENLWLYEIKLPWINRQFDSIYYSFKWNNKQYWKLASKFNKYDLWDRLIWITRFNSYYIICFIDLSTLESEYFFVKSFDIFEISLNTKNYFSFIYNDFNNKLWYFTNYKQKNYNFLLKDNIFKIKNTIFDTEIFHKLINLDNWFSNSEIKVLEIDKNTYLDIADFFIYADFFIKTNINNYGKFYDFLKKFNQKTLKINENLSVKINITKFDNLYYPKSKINLSVFTKDIKKLKLIDIRKLFLSFFAENISCNLINNRNIQNNFSEYFNDFTNLEFDKLNLDFNIPNNVYSSDKLFEKFKLDLLKLRYNLFLLKEAYKLKDKKAEWNSEYIKLVNNRLNINKGSLERIIINYEKMFSKLIDNVKKSVY